MSAPNPSAPLAQSEQDRLRGIAARLERALRTGPDAGLRVRDFDVMEDGHAGLTFGFDLREATGASRGRYILKMAPVGVARRGNTDVFRQSPLLKALKRQGLPVPDVPWASSQDAPLGAPFIVMERLAGRVFVVWEPHPSFSRDPADLRRIWLQAGALLAQVHRVDWRATLSGWEQPRALIDELDQWTRIFKHAEDPAWYAAGMRLGESLRAGLPDAAPVGLVHGDFQPGNILYEDGQVRGLIDWELSSIGAQGLDLGWMLMMIDPRAWHPGWQPVAPLAGADVIDAYRAAGGPALANLAWYQALAQYRLGAIACLNVKLHRSGKRPDDLWERFAPSIPHLLGRGIELAERAGLDKQGM
ncbi:MAG: phosphotransferase family protein [Xanthobacteraceae bacterium]|nr:phosphotransferase family protein [Xanthobacteraceae bacterium]